MSMQHSYGFFTSLDDAMNDLGTTEINLLAAAMLARDADTQEKVEAIRQEVKILKEKLRQIREIK